MKHIVLNSGGMGSWGAAKRVVERHGAADLIHLFCDTLMEDEDLYRFLEESTDQIGGAVIRLVDGRDPWQIFFDVRFLGNSRIDPCSRILKRTLTRKWLEENFKPNQVTLYVGIDWTEEHRFQKIQERYRPWHVEAPLCDPPYILKDALFEDVRALGIEPPRLYAMGFPHNNCGGFCVKAGQAHFARLLNELPERYAEHEHKEQELRDYLGKDVAILRDRRGGQVKPLTLKSFRKRLEAGGSFDRHAFGGCGCFAGI